MKVLKYIFIFALPSMNCMPTDDLTAAQLSMKLEHQFKRKSSEHIKGLSEAVQSRHFSLPSRIIPRGTFWPECSKIRSSTSALIGGFASTHYYTRTRWAGSIAS